MRILFLALLLALPSGRAHSASLPFQDAFRAFVKVRQLEEEQRLLLLRTDLEREDRASKAEKLAASLTAARIDLNAVVDGEIKALPPFEKHLLSNAVARKKPATARPKADADAETQSFLQATFPGARNFSPLEWQVIEEWVGRVDQEAFLSSTFSLEELSPEKAKAAGEKPFLVWVTVAQSPLLGQKEAQARNARVAAQIKKLEAAGYAVKELPVSPYSRLEDQAAELHLALEKQSQQGSYLLLSDGSASALLLKAFDFNPSLLRKKEITGWVNLNGQLFGPALPEKGRAPASLPKNGPSYEQDKQARAEELRLRQERLVRQPPLGAGFPVLNLVTLSESKRLRESLVPEGKTVYHRSGDAYSGLEAALAAFSK